MLPSRVTVASSSAVRKSRVEASKPSMLPRPRRTGSAEARSSGAEPRKGAPPARTHHTYRRSRSQQGEGERRAGPSVAATPARGASAASTPRFTSTPKRTPSEERKNWQAALERALAGVTVRDTRPLTNQAWQRAQTARVQEALAARGPALETAPLMRPLTIARFVDAAGALVGALWRDARLNTDNYVLRLPHLAKRLLYPGPVTKSWLCTVNTLHTYPHALALLAYFVDLVARVEAPVDDDSLYADKDELAQLQRDYLRKCWMRFQEPEPQYEDLNEEFVQRLKLTLGDNNHKINELREEIDRRRALLDDELEAAARADEARRAAVRADLLVALRAERKARVEKHSLADDLRTRLRAAQDALRAIDGDIERAAAEGQQLRHELDTQPMSAAERTKLLDQVDYSNRVVDSKRELADQLGKTVLAKDNELALWQRKALTTCVEYNQRLIQLSADRRHADLAALAVDEKELMGAGCARDVGAALDALKRTHAALGDALADLERDRRHNARRRVQALEETLGALEETRAALERERQADETERAQDSADVALWSQERRRLAEATEAVRAARVERARPLAELAHCEAHLATRRARTEELRQTVGGRRAGAAAVLARERASCEQKVLSTIRAWRQRLDLLAPLTDDGVLRD